MENEVTPATMAERPVLRQLMELYQYDFSEFGGSDIGPMGLYDYPYFDHYWIEPEPAPLLFRVNTSLNESFYA